MIYLFRCIFILFSSVLVTFCIFWKIFNIFQSKTFFMLTYFTFIECSFLYSQVANPKAVKTIEYPLAMIHLVSLMMYTEMFPWFWWTVTGGFYITNNTLHSVIDCSITYDQGNHSWISLALCVVLFFFTFYLFFFTFLWPLDLGKNSTSLLECFMQN